MHYRVFKDGLELEPQNMPIQQAAATGKTLTDFRLDFHFDDGAVRSLQGNVSPIFDARGNSSGAIAAFIDVTELKAAEEVLKRDKKTFENLVKERSKKLLEAQEELERAKRLSDIGTLAATVAHELRNPLAAITMAASNIKRKANNHLLDKNLQNIEKKVAESDQIINNLLYYSRIRAPNYENSIIQELLEECIAVSQRQFQKKVSIKKRLKDIKNISLRVDPVQIKEVFCNILNNAYDAVGDSGGSIEISGFNNDKFTKISIKDNGIGIEKENLKNIFDPFFTTKAKGTGLGLTVCWQIVRLHGGSINITSEPGKGTTVTTSLPKKLL